MKENTDNLLYTLALSYIPGLGNSTLRKILSSEHTAQNLWQLSTKEKNSLPDINSKILDKIGSEKYLELANSEIEIMKSRDISAHCITDASYPALLRNCKDAPYILFTRGSIDWVQKKQVAIVGTRKMSLRSKEFIHELVEGCKNLPISINSGLAFGVDAEAHRAALDNGLQTVAVVAHGLDKIFPKTNLPLGREILQQGGLISEFSTFHAPERENFKRRNRIIAGISHATIVVESDYKGGAMSTASYASQYQRTLFAVPGRPNDHSQRGCHRLLKNQQAMLITEPADLLQFLEFSSAKSSKPRQATIPLEFTPEESEIYQFLSQNGKMHIDDIAIALQTPTYRILPIMLQLEMKNAVRAYGGRMYEIG
ncbi:MAG: DNA-processing protein DprA [Weeksellaceae bacterium]|nr:DNA-processing protein DprA [Weeksellaceae bacterium]